jgi:type VI secretion system protein ImpH
MASPKRRSDTDLTKYLFSNPQEFDFFQAVRLLELINNEQVISNPEWKHNPVGYDYPQHREIVRFKVDPTLVYPKSEITQLVPATINTSINRLNPAQMSVTFMGLTGPSGVLPSHYSELILEQNRKKNYALSDFFDLFNHRAISFYYRGWEKYRVQYHFERTRRIGKQDDSLTKILKSLIGLGEPSLERRQKVTDDNLLNYTDRFANQRKSAAGLRDILSDYFQVPVQIKQFIGSWNRLQKSECTRMPSKRLPEGQFNLLGTNTLLGTRIWYSQAKFRVVLGPLNSQQFQQFLPGSPNLVKLKELTRTYVGIEYSFDIQLISNQQTVPACCLDPKAPPRLGYFTWLTGAQSKKDRIQHDKLILT